jgi:hypothetical protein
MPIKPRASAFTTTAAPSQDGTLEKVLSQDMARMIRQIGVHFVHASVVKVSSMTLQAGWSLTDNGEVSDTVTKPPSGMFPGASTTVTALGQASAEDTMVQKLSPRRWGFAWRLDSEYAAVTEAQFRDLRDAVSDTDTALIRLVCNTGIRAGLAAASAAGLSVDDLLWPQVDRRAPAKPLRTQWLPVVLTCVAALLAAWLALIVLPQARDAIAAQRTETEQMVKLADNTIAQGLATALATGDYGVVQTELSLFAALGYFQSAVVTNANGRVVAMAGPLEKMRIGEPVTAEYAGRARARPLSLGSERHGELRLIAATPASNASLGGSRVAAVLACLTSLVAAWLLARRLLFGRRR